MGFVAVSVDTSHMTGMVASMADNTVLHGDRTAGVGVLALASFIMGAGECAILFNWARRRHLRARYAVVLAAEALLTLAFVLLAQVLTMPHRNLVFIAVLCFTMGLQNAIITKISGSPIRTTHVTDMVTDIGIELGKAVYPKHAGDPEPVRAHGERLRMHTLLVLLFFLGGVLGAVGYRQLGFAPLLPGAVVLLLLSLPPILADHRVRMSLASPRHTSSV